MDEMEKSYFGEEFIEDDPFKAKEEKAALGSEKGKKAKKTDAVARKSISKKSEKKASISIRKEVKEPAEPKKTENKIVEVVNMSTNDEDYIEIKPAKEILEKKEAEKKEERKAAEDKDKKTFKFEVKEEKKEAAEEKKESKAAKAPFDPWAEEDKNSGLFENISTWKLISGIAVILLVFSVFTQGFRFSEPDAVATISLSDAEGKVLDYVNNQLLRPPFQASVTDAAELGSLYQITLSVAGQSIDSYVTKDGKLFFPQGFDLEKSKEAAAAGEISADENDPVLGLANAPVTIIEFSDFQCPYCQKGFEVMKQVETEYVETGKVKLVYKNFPLSFHPQAENAALAAACANEQGMFWDYHDLLFQNQEQLGMENYLKWADKLGMDLKTFESCLSSKKYAEAIAADMEYGQANGVTGTPAFFINGKLIEGAQPYEVFKAEIDALLAEVGAGSEKLPADAGAAEENEVVEVKPAEPVEEEEPEDNVQDVIITSINAKKWLFLPDKIEVSEGDQVMLTIVPSGLEFTFEIPDLSVSKEVSGPTVVEFTAEKAGTYTFKCGSCEDWRGMTGTLIVK